MATGYNPSMSWGNWGNKPPAAWQLPVDHAKVWQWERFMPRRKFWPVKDLDGPLLEYNRNDGTGDHFIKMVSNIPGSTIWFGWVSEIEGFEVIDLTHPAGVLSEKYKG